jgi:hypothetical protein
MENSVPHNHEEEGKIYSTENTEITKDIKQLTYRCCRMQKSDGGLLWWVDDSNSSPSPSFSQAQKYGILKTDFEGSFPTVVQFYRVNWEILIKKKGNLGKKIGYTKRKVLPLLIGIDNHHFQNKNKKVTTNL